MTTAQMATADPYSGMQGDFSYQLHQLMAAVNQQGGHLSISSGFRSHDEQAGAYDKAVKKYGKAQAANWAAPPGHSNHEKGMAADLSGDTRSINLAHQLAPTVGLSFPLSNEPWHVQPTGLSTHDNQGGPAAVTGNGDNTAMSRVSALINKISGGQMPIGNTSAYTDTTTDYQDGGAYSGGNLPSTQFDPLFQQAAQQFGLPVSFLKAVAQQESGFNPNARSGAGAQGIMQIMPATAKGWGVNPLDPRQAIFGAAKALSGYQRKFGSPQLALAAYNAGPGAVEKYGGVPPYGETQNYVHKIMGSLRSV